MQLAVNAEFGGAYLENLEVGFVPMTVELRADGSPRGCAVIGGTVGEAVRVSGIALGFFAPAERRGTDRKSTRLNSSHVRISYAVFCLKKKRLFNGIWVPEALVRCKTISAG